MSYFDKCASLRAGNNECGFLSCHGRIPAPPGTPRHNCIVAFASLRCPCENPGRAARFPANPESPAVGVFIHTVGYGHGQQRSRNVPDFPYPTGSAHVGEGGGWGFEKRSGAGGAPPDTRATQGPSQRPYSEISARMGARWVIGYTLFSIRSRFEERDRTAVINA